MYYPPEQNGLLTRHMFSFGYMSNTLIKFIVIYEVTAIKDPDARSVRLLVCSLI
jgi:hypothetical protein